MQHSIYSQHQPLQAGILFIPFESTIITFMMIIMSEFCNIYTLQIFYTMFFCLVKLDCYLADQAMDAMDR